MKVVWTDRAKARLRDIHDYIAQDAPGSAAEVVRQLVLRSSQLSFLPRSGRSVPEYQRQDIRELLVRPYRVIYFNRPERDRIDVLTVRHYWQPLPRDFANI